MPAEFLIGGFLRNPAWHGEGILRHQEWANAEAAMIDAGMLTHRIERLPIFYERDGLRIEVPDKFALIRTPIAGVDEHERVFQIVSNDYEIVTPSDVATIVNPLSTPDKWPVDTVGLLGKGERLFLALRMEPSYPGGDEAEKHLHYFTILDDYRGGGSLKMIVTTVRVVCANTWSLAINSNRNIVAIPHAGDAKYMLDLRVQMEAAAIESRREAVEMFGAMMKFKLDEQQRRQIIETAYQPDPEPAILVDLRKPEFSMVSLEAQERAVARANKAKYNWLNSHSRADERRTDAAMLLNKFNDEFPAYANTAYAVMNAINENSDFRKGRGDAATQVFWGERANEKTAGLFKTLEIMGYQRD